MPRLPDSDSLSERFNKSIPAVLNDLRSAFSLETSRAEVKGCNEHQKYLDENLNEQSLQSYGTNVTSLQ